MHSSGWQLIVSLRPLDVSIDSHFKHISYCIPVEGSHTNEEFVEDDAQRPVINRFAVTLTKNYLGSDVIGRTEYLRILELSLL